MGNFQVTHLKYIQPLVKMKTYTKANYAVAIEVRRSPADVFNHIINDVPLYWPEDIEGECARLNDEFVFKTGDSHYSKNRVAELAPAKKVVWLVTESIRKTDNFDWTGSKMIFELTPKGDETLVKFTYDGVIFENEYDTLVQICDMVIKERLYNLLTGKNYTAVIEVATSPHDVFQRITADVAKWWGGNDLEGNSTKLNDEFIINHPGAHYSRQKLVEVIPDKKIVWLVTESKLNWLKDQAEWTNTKMIFTIISKGDHTVLYFTHEGLSPEKESYARCSEGWSTIIRDYLATG